MATTLHIKVGDRFGRWTVKSGPIKDPSLGPARRHLCECDCGTVRHVIASKLVRNSLSCGCMKLEKFTASATRHGHTKTGVKSRLYSIWTGMKSRCSSPTNDNYHLYGGRGISVCPEWLDFINFASWAEGKYSPKLQIDRIDSNGPYSPSNCRWVTTHEQARNKRCLTTIHAFGEDKLATDWAFDPRCAVAPQTIIYRIKKLGMTPENAINLPRRTRKSAPEFIGNHVSRSDRK